MKLRISHKIIINFALILIVPMTLSVYLVSSDLAERSKKEVENQLAFTTQVVKKFFFRTANSFQVRLNVHASSSGFRNAIENSDTAEISAALRRWKDEAAFSRLDLIVSGPGTDAVIAAAGSSPAGSFNEEQKEALAEASRGKFCSRLELVDEKNSTMTFAAPVPVSSRSTGSYVLFAQIPLKNDVIDSIKEMTDIDISIYNLERPVLATRFDATGVRDISGKINPKVPAALSGAAASVTLEEKVLNDNFINVYSRLQETGRKKTAGYICVSVPSAMISKAQMYVVDYLYGIIAISLLLASISGYVLSANIARPLELFSRMANFISEGNFGQKIDMERSDEIGDLASTFNKMGGKLDHFSESLKRKVFEISTLYSVSQSMNFLNNKDQILNIILSKAIEALNSEKGSIMLFDAESGFLSCDVALGYPGKLEKRVKFLPGQGIAGTAFLDGKTVVANDTQHDPRFMRTDGTQSSDNVTRNLLCIPMKSKDEMIGVINIVNSKNGSGFSDSDVALAEALASQAAVTIDNARLYELSITDGMTRLFIHRYFQIRLDAEIKRSIRYDKPFSLVMTDIDHFKKFNDTYGHQVGDMVLIKVADIMRETIRNEVDIACRYGGEEFAVIAPETGVEEARRMAERIRVAVEGADLKGPMGQTLKITISLGISTYPDNAKEKKDLIVKADTALYYSKENGRNRASHFGDLPPGRGECPGSKGH